MVDTYFYRSQIGGSRIFVEFCNASCSKMGAIPIFSETAFKRRGLTYMTPLLTVLNEWYKNISTQ